MSGRGSGKRPILPGSFRLDEQETKVFSVAMSFLHDTMQLIADGKFKGSFAGREDTYFELENDPLLKIPSSLFMWIIVQAIQRGMFEVGGPLAETMKLDGRKYAKFTDAIAAILEAVKKRESRFQQITGKKISRERLRDYLEFYQIIRDQTVDRGEEQNLAQASRVMKKRHEWTEQQRLNFLRAYAKVARRIARIWTTVTQDKL